MSDYQPITEEEARELVAGVHSGFAEARFLDRFLRALAFDVHCRAVSPVDLFLSLLNQHVSSVPDVRLRAALSGGSLRRLLRAAWSREMERNRLSGHLVASLTAGCVEAYLQNGLHFTRGPGTNDLVRVADGARWEVKGLRNRVPLLKINQSHVGIDATTFLLYCGLAERGEVYGVYYLVGCEEYFSPRLPGRNFRQLLPQYVDRLVRIYP